MQIFRSRTAASLAALAALTMTAAPVFARGHDDWRRHRYDRRGISGGDLLAGLLVIGGVAAIASAVSKKNERDNAPEPYRYPGGPEAGDRDYGDAPEGERDYGSSAYPGGPAPDAAPAAAQGRFGEAVDACSAELERGGNRVDSVDGVRRMNERYSVEGRLDDGRPYACSVDDTGRIRSVAVDGHGMI